MSEHINSKEKKLKILFFVEAMGGGVFTYIVDLSNELVKKYDMYVAYGIRPQTPKDFKRYFDPRIHLIFIPDYGRSVNLRNDWRSFREMQKIEREVKPDIIHLHSSKSGALGRWAFNGRKIPMFYTPHGYSFLMSNYGWAKRVIYKIVEELSARRSCTTIACSKGEYEETLKMTKRAEYVNNGINVKELSDLLSNVSKPESKDDDKKQLNVFTLGRINYQKGPDLFNAIAEKMPEVNFIWIGDGPLRDKLTSSNVTITGWLDRKEALSISEHADVFLLTSLWEGMPISLLESMFMKKLCVVSDVIGNHDVIHNGVNGYVCKSVDDFANAVQKAGESEELVSNAYNDVIANYNTSVMAEKYSQIYEEAHSIVTSKISNRGGDQSEIRLVLATDAIAFEEEQFFGEAVVA